MQLTEETTVQAYADEHKLQKMWICPSLVSIGKIGLPPYLAGMDCSRNTIPEEVQNKKVIKVFTDNGTTCIIWENDEDVSFRAS